LTSIPPAFASNPSPLKSPCNTSEKRLEDCLIRRLVDLDEVSYDDHADLLHKLAGQMVGAASPSSSKTKNKFKSGSNRPGTNSIYYSSGHSHEPDFIAETATRKRMCEPRRACASDDPIA
jgi:hypothetical protein